MGWLVFLSALCTGRCLILASKLITPLFCLPEMDIVLYTSCLMVICFPHLRVHRQQYWQIAGIALVDLVALCVYKWLESSILVCILPQRHGHAGKCQAQATCKSMCIDLSAQRPCTQAAGMTAELHPTCTCLQHCRHSLAAAVRHVY